MRLSEEYKDKVGFGLVRGKKKKKSERLGFGCNIDHPYNKNLPPESPMDFVMNCGIIPSQYYSLVVSKDWKSLKSSTSEDTDRDLISVTYSGDDLIGGFSTYLEMSKSLRLTSDSNEIFTLIKNEVSQVIVSLYGWYFLSDYRNNVISKMEDSEVTTISRLSDLLSDLLNGKFINSTNSHDRRFISRIHRSFLFCMFSEELREEVHKKNFQTKNLIQLDLKYEPSMNDNFSFRFNELEYHDPSSSIGSLLIKDDKTDQFLFPLLTPIH